MVRSADPEFRILGPLEVWHGERQLDVGLRRQRLILGVLLLEAGRLVRLDRLIELAWYPETPPRTARNAVQVCISNLRSRLGSAAPIVTAGDAYKIDVDPGVIDVHRFRFLVFKSRELPAEQAVTALRRAAALWRGPVMMGAFSEELRQHVCSGLDEERTLATEERIDLELQLGLHTRLVGELTDLVQAHATRERLISQLMLALYRDGQVPRALQVYHDARAKLADELGIDPSPELRDLEVAILRHSPDLQQPSAAPVRLLPAQLPLVPWGFTGRETELARLDTILTTMAHQPTAVAIAVVSGMAGVGKTTLALHWAHRAASRATDGQFYVNLQGFGPGKPALTAADALRGFLEALGVTHSEMPSTVPAMAAMYRSLLADKRMLVIADNASDEDQVRPLLPGSPGSMALVTSRDRLSGLAATEGAHLINLDVLTAEDARQMLHFRLGGSRVTAEPEAVEEIIARCARLPLALAVTAARAASHPGSPLETLARQLSDARTGLDAFAADDTASSVRVVFSWSYHGLSSSAGTLFRLLAIHPGPSVSVAGAASLLGEREGQVRVLLTELTNAHLLTEATPDRFAMHDLLRAYGTELTEDVGTERQEATRRMLDYYLHTAYSGALLLHPLRTPITLTPAQPGANPVSLADIEDTMRWFQDEQQVLMAAIRQAADLGYDTHAWQLTWAIAYYFGRRGNWHDWAAAQRVALEAAGRLGDRTALAYAHRGLARALTRLGNFQEAHIHLDQALALCGELNDHAGQAITHQHLAEVCSRQNLAERAAVHAQQACDLYQAIGNRAGEAVALNNLGWYQVQLGNYQQALTHCERALAIHQETADLNAEAATWDSLGYAHHRLGNPQQAAACYQRAVLCYQAIGEPYGQTETLTRLGDMRQASGDHESAHEAWQEALEILEKLGHRDVEKLRAKLLSIE